MWGLLDLRTFFITVTTKGFYMIQFISTDSHLIFTTILESRSYSFFVIVVAVPILRVKN